jgi:hypothetical protein
MVQPFKSVLVKRGYVTRIVLLYTIWCHAYEYYKTNEEQQKFNQHFGKQL